LADVEASAAVRRVGRFLVRYRDLTRFLVDATAWALALFFAALLRFDFDLAAIDGSALLVIILTAVLLQFVAGAGWGIYTGRWRHASLEEMVALGGSVATTTTFLFLLVYFLDGRRGAPLSVILAGGVAALVVMAASRVLWRHGVERHRRPRQPASRLLVVGAGDAAADLLAWIMRNPASTYLPVALLDDDPGKRNLRLSGVPVVGTTAAIARAAEHHRADTMLIAIPSADAALVRRLTEAGEAAGLTVTILPTVAELVGGAATTADIRPVTITDLLGRREIDTDLSAIAGYLTGKRVLVTGAGGSIGAELCRQISRFGPAELVMLDRDESALHGVQLSIEGRALLDTDTLVLADLRDAERIHQILLERRPEVVFHAAALKHLTLLERAPEEAVKTNVFGTLTMLRAAKAAGVARFVNISTDKAADPTSVLGASKRLAERLTAQTALEAEGTYLSIRFGNVLGSRGSMLGTFQAQVAAGGPITVTHPDVTRYFMTVEEAVQLTIQAGAIGWDGEVPTMAAKARRWGAQQQLEVDVGGGDVQEPVHRMTAVAAGA
jgi:FlaA1/EpsC-like NDP-sugar epimerase